ncbi:MAG: AMP-binding protein [Chlorogloeopsis fritschii C42_A2020_084]|uniref:AMP-dependent synthetase/ligase n=1 Tax=Chlorogloeopsis fritschii TaxID=1124 RepID=UPI0019FE316D|nr:AMP-binding protein [Chlorogloeopsis fritschii]MBF2005328.1 AMP-binding protein [Chlorogloeopsis fritschii C42_A2020_084]
MLWTDRTYKAPPNSGKILLGRTLPSLLDEACDRYFNPQALNEWTEKGWQSLSNQEFQSAAEELALSLLDLVGEKGNTVALLMHSNVNFCIVDMGCLLAGLVDVPIDLTQTLENIIFILRHSQAKVLIVANLDLLSQVIPYLGDAPALKAVIVADVPSDWQQNQNLEQICPECPQHIPVFSLWELRAKGRALNSQSKRQQLRSQLAANDLATIIYIPGVMGEAQGVMLTHENLSGDAFSMFTGIPDLEFGEKEVTLSYLPLTHVFARVFLYGHISYGHSIYLTTPNRVIKHFKEVQPTLFATVPLLLERVYNKILEEGTRRTKLATQTEVKHNVLSRILTFATQMLRREQSKMQRFRLSSLRWKFPPLRISVSGSGWREMAFQERIYNWALNLAKQYEIGKPPKGRYALMMKLADKLVFWQWRLIFGGRIKYLICGGAALKAEIANLFTAAGVTILQGYGLTETSSAVTSNRGQFNRAGTVGVPLAGVEIAIADDGEILTRSPYITQGYYNNPEATQQLIDADGWLHTGDLGEFTADGFLKITGLKKSRFKLSTGKYVTPQPIETKLEQSPLVAKAVAVGAERKFCAMLIFPNLDNLHSYALTIGIDLPPDALLNHPCIIAIYKALVEEANCHLPYWSTVKRFQLINATLTVENGLLAPNQQVQRAKVVETFAKEIDAIYEDAPATSRKVDTGTQRHEDAKTGNTDEQDNPLSSCPSIPQASCPAFAQSLTL